MTDLSLLVQCWLSGQIEPAEMLRLCAADPALEAMRAERDAARA